MAPSSATFGDVQDILVRGGYYRARLTAVLTEFDIVAGGLSWGIRNSRFAIDVEFVEDAAIRHKIKIAENICRALKEGMKCPYDLRPHQVQGLDFPAIATVLRWLLLKVAAVREENAYFTRQHTKLLFERKFGCPLFDNVPALTAPPPGEELTANTHLEPHPHSQLRRLFFRGPAPRRVMIPSSQSPTFASQAEHVSSILLEYGDRYVVTEAGLQIPPTAKDDRQLDADEVQDRREQAAQAEQEAREQAVLERLIKSMAAAHDDVEMMTSARLGAVLATTDSSKLQRLRAQYEERRQALQEQLAAEEAERSRLENRKERLAALQEEESNQKSKWIKTQKQAKKAGIVIAEMTASTEEEEAAVTELEAQVAAAELEARKDPAHSTALDAVLSKRAEVDALETEIQNETERQLQHLAEVRSDVAALQQQVEDAGDAAGGGTAEYDRLTALKKDLETQLHALSLSNLDLQRRIDSYPTRLELEQYNIRVDELDEEIAWKYEETKMAYYRFNTQVEVRRCVDNELEVFNGVRKQFDNCAATVSSSKEGKTARSEFIEDIERFVVQLGAAATAQRAKLADEEAALRCRSDECATLVQKQQEITHRLDAMRRAIEKEASLKAQLRELEEGDAATRNAE